MLQCLGSRGKGYYDLNNIEVHHYLLHICLCISVYPHRSQALSRCYSQFQWSFSNLKICCKIFKKCCFHSSFSIKYVILRKIKQLKLFLLLGIFQGRNYPPLKFDKKLVDTRKKQIFSYSLKKL